MGEGKRETSGALWTAIIGIWGLATGVLIVRLLPDILRSPATAFLVACLSFFVLSGVFNLVVNVASHFLKEEAPPASRPGGGRPGEVARRPARRGYKAGAINDALRRLPPEVRYVAIVDSDELVAPDFIQGCLRHFVREDIGFVQANHRCYTRGASWFTDALGIGVDLHWRHYQRYRDRYGTVNMLGHGAGVRRDVLERVGGFPEVTCEERALP